MKTTEIIQGLVILQKYRENQEGYDVGAEHDAFFAYFTDRPLDALDLNRMIELGWSQEDVSGDGEFSVENYDAEESWIAYV